MVAGNEEFVILLVVQGKGEYSVEVFDEVGSLLLVQCQYYLAVAARLETESVGILSPYFLVVVYLSVYGKDLLAVRREQGLLAALGVYDAQPLVSQYRTLATIYAAPVWSAMANLLAHAQGFFPQACCLLLDVEY